jgi:uncharacterized protein YjiS (DUF1127 family)
MKPDYRTTAPSRHQTAPSLARAVRARIAAWWQSRRARREERIQREALALLGPHLLEDIGVRDGMRVHARAIRDARYERMARLIAR